MAPAYQFLKLHHECEGAYTQLILIQEAFTLHFACSACFAMSFNAMKDLIKHIFNIGFPSMDSFLQVVLLNMLQGKLVGLHDQVVTAMSATTITAPYTLNDILKQLELEQQLLDGTVWPTDTALLANQKERLPTSNKLCSNCNHTSHLVSTCWREGGRMAGKHDEILAEKAKKHSAPASLPLSRPSTSLSAKSGTHYDSAGCAFILDSEGFAVYLTSSNAVNPSTSNPMGSLLDTTVLLAAFPDEPFADFEAFLASTKDFAATINWNSCSIPGTSPVIAPVKQTFILDTGTTTHISFCCSDFVQMLAIPPHVVCGVSGSRISAIGVGTINLHLGSTTNLVLHHVLYIPDSHVWLISIPTLCDDDAYVTTFNSSSCSIRTQDSTLVVTGSKTGHRALYVHHCKPVFVHHAHVAQHASSLATWHQHLRHINYNLIVQLACLGLASSMHVDLSTLPPKCDHCLIGKQTRNSIPKVWQGQRATRCLEKVFIDLSSPHITTASGFSYVMHIVDDFSSFIWSIPLCDKSCAFSALCAWQCLHEAELSLHVGTYCTDHGELWSSQMEAWLSSCAAKQEFMAPYTSAQNGCSEHTHLTIMNLS